MIEVKACDFLSRRGMGRELQMTASFQYQFFILPEELFVLVDKAVELDGSTLYVQLHEPGIVLEPICHSADMEDTTSGSNRLVIFHGDLDAGSRSGTFSGNGHLGLIVVDVPLTDHSSFYLGSVEAKCASRDDINVRAGSRLNRQIRRATPGRLLVRNTRYGHEAPASGLGASVRALELARHRNLALRQRSVTNLQFFPIDTNE